MTELATPLPKRFEAAPVGLASADYVQSLAKGLAVLSAFGADAPTLTASEAAERVGVTRAAARRLLLTLAALGFVTHQGKRFAPTPKSLELARSFLASVSWLEAARGPMESAVAATQETCSLAMLDDDEIVFVQRVEATARLMSVNVRVGTRMPALNTSSGRVMIAHMSPADQDRLLSRPFNPMTSRAIKDPEALREKLAEARRDGISIVDEEMEAGFRSVSAPIFDPRRRPVAALAMLTQTGRVSVDDLRSIYAPALVRAAEDVGRLITL